MSTEIRYLCTKEAARFLRVSTSALEKGRAGLGNINPPFVRFGRAIRYRLDELIAWADAHRFYV